MDYVLPWEGTASTCRLYVCKMFLWVNDGIPPKWPELEKRTITISSSSLPRAATATRLPRCQLTGTTPGRLCFCMGFLSSLGPCQCQLGTPPSDFYPWPDISKIKIQPSLKSVSLQQTWIRRVTENSLCVLSTAWWLRQSLLLLDFPSINILLQKTSNT